MDLYVLGLPESILTIFPMMSVFMYLCIYDNLKTDIKTFKLKLKLFDSFGTSSYHERYIFLPTGLLGKPLIWVRSLL